MQMPQKTIIVAEDEPLLRMLASEMLSIAGYHVIEAADAQSALAELSGNADQIHLLFTDINMPGDINGVQLAHIVRERWPQVAILVTSSATNWRVSDLPAGGRLVSKPYSMVSIVAHAEQLLAA